MYYWIYAILYIFFTIIIGQLIIEQNLKLIYYFIMLLLYVSLNNVYFSVLYYIKLRNHKGIKGDRGEPGEPGSGGSNGVCAMSKGCGIANCRKLIEDTLIESFPEYRNIKNKIKKNIELDSSDKKIKQHVETYLGILIPKCETYETDEPGSSIKDFKNIIQQTINNS